MGTFNDGLQAAADGLFAGLFAVGVLLGEQAIANDEREQEESSDD